MRPIVGEDGCPGFELAVDLQGADGQEFRWGVVVSTATQADVWGIMPEIGDQSDGSREQTFVLRSGSPQVATYHLTHARRVGAQKYFLQPAEPLPVDGPIRFTVWAPNARNVNVLMVRTWDVNDSQRTPLDNRPINVARIAGGYIAGRYVDPDNIVACYAMQPIGDGFWATDPNEPELASFRALDHCPYMYEVSGEDGKIRYRTDLHSRCQIGAGKFDPSGKPYDGRILDLDGSKSCSVVVNPEWVTQEFEERNEQGEVIWPETKRDKAEDFWRDEFRPDRPVPRNVQDLVLNQA